MMLSWLNDIENSSTTMTTFCKEVGVRPSVIVKYSTGAVKPREKTVNKIQAKINEVIMEPKMQKHPSYGYATQDEIKRLNEIGIGPQRDKILSDVEKRTRMKGKLK